MSSLSNELPLATTLGSSADGAGGVLDMVGDAPKLSSMSRRSGDGSRSSLGATGDGAGMAAAAAAGAGSFMKGAMGFFSPTSLARQKKFEDERREASLDIMGESSQIIAALKAEVKCVCGGRVVA